MLGTRPLAHSENGDKNSHEVPNRNAAHELAGGAAKKTMKALRHYQLGLN